MARVVQEINVGGGHGNFIAFDDKDMKLFIEKLKNLPDKFKRTEMNKLIKRQMMPVLSSLIADTPESEGKSRGKYGKSPGNLKRSMTISFRKNPLIGVWVGPKINRFSKYKTDEQNAKAKDGYYGFWVEKGTKHMKGTHFIERSAEKSMPTVQNQLSAGVKDYLVKQIQGNLLK